MKKIIPLCLMFLIFIVGCTQNQFSNETEIHVKILDVNSSYMSIKYRLGNDEIFDDIVLQAEAQRYMLGRTKNITLKLVTTGRDHEGRKESTAKYYYGINYVGSSKVFKDYDTLLRLAKKNPSLFKWIVKDGNFVKKGKEKEKIKNIEISDTVKKL